MCGYSNSHVIEATKGVKSVDCVVHIEPPREMGQDQLHPWVSQAVVSNGLLVLRVAQGALPYHVQRDRESVTVGRGNKVLG
jgi:hypothetical protein